MPIYSTLYENDAGQVVRGPDVGATNWVDAMTQLRTLVLAGGISETIRIIGEHSWSPPNEKLTSEQLRAPEFNKADIPFPPEKPIRSLPAWDEWEADND